MFVKGYGRGEMGLFLALGSNLESFPARSDDS
jgi:hypothetical protein